MTELMAGGPLESGTLAGAQEDRLHSLCTQPLASARALQGHEDPIGRGVLRSLLHQILAQLGEEGVGDGHHPLVATLSLGDEHRTFGDLDVGQPETEHLAAPQTAEHHGEDHGPIPMGAHRPDQCVDLAGRENLRQRPGHPHQRHRQDPTTTPAGGQPLRHRVCLDGRVAPGHQIRIEARHRRQPTGDGAGRQSRLAIGEPDHRAVAALVSEELEDIGRNDGDWVLVDDGEERLQVEGDRPARCSVWPDPPRTPDRNRSADDPTRIGSLLWKMTCGPGRERSSSGHVPSAGQKALRCQKDHMCIKRSGIPRAFPRYCVYRQDRFP